MKKIFQIIRIVTVPPIMAGLLITVLFICPQDVFVNWYSYIIGLFTLTFLPLIAYPVQRVFKVIKGDMRRGERRLAIIFSICGYLLGFILAIILKAPMLEKAVYLTYVFSVVLIALFSFAFKINASGHGCGVAGPIVPLCYIISWWFAFLLILLVFVFWSSWHLKRHTIMQLILGSLFSFGSFFIALLCL